MLKAITHSDDTAVLGVIRELPEVKAVLKKEEALTLRKREQLAVRIIDGDRAAEAAWKKLSDAIDVAKAEYERAAHAYHESCGALNAAVAARSQASFSWTNERNRLENELIESADGAIPTFIREMRDAWEVAMKEHAPNLAEVKVNPNTGKREVATLPGKIVRPVDRMRAINEVIAEAQALQLEPDQSNVAAKLDALRAALPKVGVIAP